MTIRVRFAPSPTGGLHLGNARTALFNWLYARHHGGTFVLRIEDTDRARSTDESIQGIIEALEWLGIATDEPPVLQSLRFDAHVALARKLEDSGHAYRCYCDKERLDALRAEQRERGAKPRYDRHCLDREAPSPDAPYVLRFKTPRDGHTEIDDLVKGKVTVGNDQLDDLILLRTDGTPTYNFVVVCDDSHMGITHVIRGDDHLNNTFRQYHIYTALGFDPPRFGHLPLIKGLSKRLGSTSVQGYRDRGFLKEAVVNYMARLGWSHGDDEVFSEEELFEKFDLNGVAKAPAAFDEDKLTWLNQHYLKTLPDGVVAERLLPFLLSAGVETAQAGAKLDHLVRVLKERAKTLIDMAEMCRFAYERPTEYDAKAVKKWIKGAALEVIDSIADQLDVLTEFTGDAIESLVRDEAERRELKLGKVAQPIRVCLTGTAVSPPLFDTVALVGQAESVARLRLGRDALSGDETLG